VVHQPKDGCGRPLPEKAAASISASWRDEGEMKTNETEVAGSQVAGSEVAGPRTCWSRSRRTM